MYASRASPAGGIESRPACNQRLYQTRQCRNGVMRLASSERGATRKALPALKRILSGPTEIDYFRADVLLAIFEVAPARAQELASTVVPSQVRDRFQILPIMIQTI